jgi:hypothetical protein
MDLRPLRRKTAKKFDFQVVFMSFAAEFAFMVLAVAGSKLAQSSPSRLMPRSSNTMKGKEDPYPPGAAMMKDCACCIIRPRWAAAEPQAQEGHTGLQQDRAGQPQEDDDGASSVLGTRWLKNPTVEAPSALDAET